MPDDADSTWSCTNYQGGRAEESASTVGTTQRVAIATTARRATTETYRNPSHTGRPAKVKGPVLCFCSDHCLTVKFSVCQCVCVISQRRREWYQILYKVEKNYFNNSWNCLTIYLWWVQLSQEAFLTPAPVSPLSSSVNRNELGGVFWDRRGRGGIGWG